MEYKNGKILRLFVDESDKYDGKSLYQWIIEKAVEMNMSGATVLRGIEGFGTHKNIHSSNILCLSLDLPIIIKIIDTDSKINEFIDTIKPALNNGLLTIEDLKMHFFNK